MAVEEVSFMKRLVTLDENAQQSVDHPHGNVMRFSDSPRP
jgi:hypothetical protein